jgi:cytochrome bd-type quinol oxidase subunit 1
MSELRDDIVRRLRNGETRDEVWRDIRRALGLLVAATVALGIVVGVAVGLDVEPWFMDAP